MTDVENTIAVAEEADGGSACQTIGLREEPPLKRRKGKDFCPLSSVNLEARLLRVLSCSVCLDLPAGPVYQVQPFVFFVDYIRPKMKLFQCELLSGTEMSQFLPNVFAAAVRRTSHN